MARVDAKALDAEEPVVQADAAQVRARFGDWRSAQAYQRVPQPYQDRPDTTIVVQTPDKANAFFIAGQNLKLRDDDPDYPALVLGNYMLGGGFLNSRLAVRIRQKDGLSYGVGSRRAKRSGRNMSGSGNASRLRCARYEHGATVIPDGSTRSRSS